MIRLSKDIVTAAHQPCLGFEDSTQSTLLEEVMATDFASTFLARGEIFLLSFFMIWAFWLWSGCKEQAPLGWESKAKLQPQAG
jgi:hypothetical protein